MRAHLLSVVASVALVPSVALAQWSDNFDAYPVGSINGLGGWQGWDNVPGAAGQVSNAQALSGPNSQAIGGPADSVRQYSGVNAGAWSYIAWQYIPTAFTGTTYFILNNSYADGGPYTWAVEMSFVGATNTVLDDFRAENPVSIVRGVWAEIRVDFNLTTNTISEYYNGALLSSGTWTVPAGGGGPLALGAVDLYAGGSGTVYYDNMSLVPGPAGAGLLGLAGLILARRRRRA